MRLGLSGIWLFALLLLGGVGILSPASAQQLTLNLKEADIETLIQTVAEVTGKNFVVDQRVQGKVTVVSTTPMDEAELYEVFLSILSVHGFAAIPSGKVIKIMPETLAKTESPQPLEEFQQQWPAGDEIVTRVVSIKHISAAQLIPILRPLLPQQSHLAAYPDNNTLIISDRAANVQRLLKIIRRLDQPEQNEIDVVMLEHAAASEVVRVLNNLGQRGPTAQGGPNLPTLVADERTNSILVGGDPATRLRIKALIAHLDIPLQTVGNTQVVFLRYAKAEDLVDILQGISDSLSDKKNGAGNRPGAVVAGGNKESPGMAGGVAVNTNIQADENTNSLIITAAPDLMQTLLSVIRQLDLRRAQVLVEAIIAELNTSVTHELGVQWLVDGTPGNRGPVGLINFGSPGSGIIDLAGSLLNQSVPSGNNFNGALAGAGRFNHDSLNFAVLLRALAADSGANVLSTPSLVTMDNEEAEIVVGQNVPFVTGQYTNTGASAGATNPFQTIQREDVGLKLKVKPQINEGNSIRLEIEQEVSNITTSAVTTADVVTNKRTIKTTVMVENGNVVVLGGLMDERLNDSAQKVPGLGDIPVLGNLFRYQKADREKRNLMIFLRPVILRDPKVESDLSNRRYNLMREAQLNYRRDGVPFTEPEDVPVLMDLNQLLSVLPGEGIPLAMPGDKRAPP